MKIIFKHIRTCIFRGVLAVIPLVLSYFVIRFLYFAIDQEVAPLVQKVAGIRIPGLGIFLVLVLLYLLGLGAGNWLGRKVFKAIERVMERIPLVKTVYHLGKQLGVALSLPEKQVFQRAVLIENFRSGLYSIAFVTGEIQDPKEGGPLLKLFIPTAPNPTTGFMIMVGAKEVREVDWTIQEAMNTVISGGIISPDRISGSAVPRKTITENK
jgi:uncharacterized membrane protein